MLFVAHASLYCLSLESEHATNLYFRESQLQNGRGEALQVENLD